MKRIIRGVRIVTPEGMQAASVHLDNGQIVAIAGYDEIPRTAIPEELGKGVLMPGIVATARPEDAEDGGERAARSGVTTLLFTALPNQPMAVHTALASPPAPPDSDLSSLLCRTWTQMRNLGQPVEDIVPTLCTLPARKSGLEKIAGTLRIGMRADLIVWHPEYSIVGSAPVLYGQLRHTIVGGRSVYKDGVFSPA